MKGVMEQTDIFTRPKTKLSQADRILQALKSAKDIGITSRDMVNMGIFKYSSRIAELRQDGHNIVGIRQHGSLWKYYLKEDN